MAADMVLRRMEEGISRVWNGGHTADHESLLRAAVAGNVQDVQTALHQGAPLAGTEEYGRSALHLAAGAGHESVVKLLGGQKPDVSARDMVGQTPLHLASTGEVVERLCKAKAFIDAQDLRGATPLHVVASNSKVAAVRKLLALRANANLLDKEGRTVLHYAAIGGVAVLGELLTNCASCAALLKFKDAYGRTALHAVRHGKAAEVLLSHGASLEAIDSNQRTPLLRAASCGNLDVVLQLLTQKANTSAADSGSWTALHLASVQGHAGVVRALLEHGVSVQVVDAQNSNAMHLAARNGHCVVAKELLKAKIQLEGKCKSGFTALHLAVVGGSASVVELLATSRANLRASDRQGRTALELAQQFQQDSVVERLTSAV